MSVAHSFARTMIVFPLRSAIKVTPTSVCLVHATTSIILLVVQSGTTGFKLSDPTAHVIAEAIASATTKFVEPLIFPLSTT